MKVLTPLLLISLLTQLSPLVHSQSAFDTEVLTYKQVGESDALIIKRYFPKNQAAYQTTPAVVFFFGGGWSGGDISHFAPQAEHLAAQGITVFTPQYRTKKSHGVDPNICAEDAWDAMRFVYRNAVTFKLDPKRIAAGGGSAGGHLAALTAFCPAPSNDYENCRPQLLLLFNPVIDNGPKGYGHERVAEYWKAFSPLHNIDSFLPPTLFLIGDSDKLIPLETAYAFEAKMNQNGTHCRLHVFEKGEHGFFNQGRVSSNGKEYFPDCIERMDTFLRDYGYLE